MVLYPAALTVMSPWYYLIVLSKYTGQISASDDEPAAKKSKPSSSSVKKVEPKPETKTTSESLTQVEDMEIEKEESDDAPEPITGSAAEATPQPSFERAYVPLTQTQNSLESSLASESSLYPTSYAGGVITTVTVSGKDPRTAMSTSLASVSAGTSASHPIPVPEKVSLGESRVEVSRSALQPPKSILTKPSSSFSDPRYLAVSPSLNVGYVRVLLRNCIWKFNFHCIVMRLSSGVHLPPSVVVHTQPV